VYVCIIEAVQKEKFDNGMQKIEELYTIDKMKDKNN
jgi:hypothetical protein